MIMQVGKAALLVSALALGGCSTSYVRYDVGPGDYTCPPVTVVSQTLFGLSVQVDTKDVCNGERK